ncbi:hypothetical protein K7432_003899 [Basidiobolus ranarum]|uniref:Uncharacterized protein n=1 Tax=Basidiobolus ranarum TaxID=34480 RepID=A0ABR2W6C7_9FUNG
MRSQRSISYPLRILLVICSQGVVYSVPVSTYFSGKENKELYKREEEIEKANPSPSTGDSLKKFFEEEAKGRGITIGSINISPLYIAVFVCGVIVLTLLCVVICCIRSRRAKRKKLEKEVNSSCYMFEDIPSTRPNPSNRGGQHETRRSEFGELLDGEEGYSLSPQRVHSSTLNLLNNSVDSDFSETSSNYSGVRGKQTKEAAWRLGDLKLGSPHQSPPRRYLRDSYRVW